RRFAARSGLDRGPRPARQGRSGAARAEPRSSRRLVRDQRRRNRREPLDRADRGRLSRGRARRAPPRPRARRERGRRTRGPSAARLIVARRPRIAPFFALSALSAPLALASCGVLLGGGPPTAERPASDGGDERDALTDAASEGEAAALGELSLRFDP